MPRLGGLQIGRVSFRRFRGREGPTNSAASDGVQAPLQRVAIGATVGAGDAAQTDDHLLRHGDIAKCLGDVATEVAMQRGARQPRNRHEAPLREVRPIGLPQAT